MKARRHEGAQARRLAASRRRARGFTLVELMIAVAVLVVIIVSTSKIFSTVGKVTSLGQATADVLQETTAIERQIRNDFERLAPNGVFAIRCVSIRNDINVPIGPLLNPALPDIAMIRADQLLFFTNGVQSIQTFRAKAGLSHKGQSTAARVYYGHAFQLPEAKAIDVIDLTQQEVRAHDPDVDSADPLVPWYSGDYGMVRTVFRSDSGGSPPDYFTFEDVAIDATQPVAPQWLLARHAVLLADDGGSEAVFLTEFFFSPNILVGNRSAYTIFLSDFDAVIRNGRVDAAATQLNDIRNVVTNFGSNDWLTQRDIISSNLLFYPRAERIAPGMHRVDQALTNNVLASACSSFIVEWTYSDGVGEVLDDFGVPIWTGVLITPGREQPWFGMPDADRGVFPFDTWPDPGVTIFPANIEQYDPPNTQGGDAIQATGAVVYEAFFGYNRDTPLDPTTGEPWDMAATGVGYTPWPSSIRITMVLHDPATKLEVGREVQFVINLPNRVR